jgi:hypothetical protein
MNSHNNNCVYDDYYMAIKREESSLLNYNDSSSDQQIPNTSRFNVRPMPAQPVVTITTPTGEHQQYIPQKSDTEIVMRSPDGLNGGSGVCQCYTKLQEVSSDEKRLYQQQENQFNVNTVKDLRWIQWRMTLFVFYWIVWFIFLIGVIIIVALRAKT